IPCALNAANEVAVAAFLKDKIGFYDISSVVSETLSRTEFVEKPSLDDIFATNEKARAVAAALIW
ncbi:MAG: 1-deoxy-D-xylulose-5-phosphate reductoisomerase, partial [Bacteroidales bacterium]|nr:1-deoxy-D-xylulose-5-phosphate reductoisomerase [Bacteroidales bacterium]